MRKSPEASHGFHLPGVWEGGIRKTRDKAETGLLARDCCVTSFRIPFRQPYKFQFYESSRDRLLLSVIEGKKWNYRAVKITWRGNRRHSGCAGLATRVEEVEINAGRTEPGFRTTLLCPVVRRKILSYPREMEGIGMKLSLGIWRCVDSMFVLF